MKAQMVVLIQRTAYQSRSISSRDKARDAGRPKTQSESTQPLSAPNPPPANSPADPSAIPEEGVDVSSEGEAELPVSTQKGRGAAKKRGIKGKAAVTAGGRGDALPAGRMWVKAIDDDVRRLYDCQECWRNWLDRYFDNPTRSGQGERQN